MILYHKSVFITVVFLMFRIDLQSFDPNKFEINGKNFIFLNNY